MYFLDRYPDFGKLVERVFLKSPMQKKHILKYLAGRETLFFQQAEEFAKGFMNYLAEVGITLDAAVDAYLNVCNDMLAAQIKFAKTGIYNCQSFEEVERTIYSNPETMSYHMLGLLISQFLWLNHYEMYDFFCKEITAVDYHVHSYLEIGAGHGLFLSKALDTFKDASFIVIDISEVSIDMARRIIRHMSKSSDDVCFRQQDIFTFDENLTFDFITMGEVLEHVDDPKSLLDKVNKLLNPDGRAYISTCCNCPAIDHIYLFRNIEEIHALFSESGLWLEREIALPVQIAVRDSDKCECVGINYAAIVTHREM
jgi:2-polyprenyl-3-methyl-5-hydroxy-6-metoxy-1,4-benzoquinol methylase